MMLNDGVEQSLIAIKRLLKCNRKRPSLKQKHSKTTIMRQLYLSTL